MLDPATGEVTYCNAGHNPPLLVRRDGKMELPSGGLILGILPLATYTEGGAADPGDTVVLFSDGVTEAAPPSGDGDFGEERLAQTVKRFVPRRPWATSSTKWCGRCACGPEASRFAHDVTLLVARRV